MIREWFRSVRLRRRLRSFDVGVELSRVRSRLNAGLPPRGLLWRRVRAVGDPLWAVDAGGELVALLQVEVDFLPDPEASDDDDMSDAPGLSLTRSATVIFRATSGGWIADEKVRFNLSPSDLLDRFAGELRPLTG